MQELIALVDTGFTGELKVSPQTAQELGLEITHTQTIALGDGSSVIWSAALPYVSIEHKKLEVSVLIAQGPTIIGVSLLKNFGYTLTLNFPEDMFVLQSKETGLFSVDE